VANRATGYPLLAILGAVALTTAVVVLSTSGASSTARAATAQTRCTRVVRSNQDLRWKMRHVQPGSVVCLAPGDYAVQKLTLRGSGTAKQRIVLRSLVPSRPATIVGAVWLTDSANYWTIENLRFDGRNRWDLPSPSVNGDYSIWLHDDVTNNHAGASRTGGGICFVLGSPGYGVAVGTTIELSSIHDCGVSDNENHGIYIENTGGTTRIEDNWIYRNGDRGIQLYPAAWNVVIRDNVIDANGSGVIFAGDHGRASRHNIVTGNVISNSRNRWNVESWYPDGTTLTGNIVAANCVWADAGTYYDTNGGIAPEVGFVSVANKIARPVFVDPDRGNFRLARTSGCKGFGPPADMTPSN
jgi:parallel beta-helix repeat protein